MPTATENVTVRDWATAVLTRLGVPVTEANIRLMVAWAAAEGGHWHNPDRYNPLGTTLPEPGSHATNSVGVQSYASWDSGIAATVSMLNQANMAGIKSALKTGQGGDAAANAITRSPWGTKTIDLASGIPGNYNPTSVGSSSGFTPSAGGSGGQTSSATDQLNAAKAPGVNDWIAALDKAMTPDLGWNPLKDTGETLKYVAVRGGLILVGLTFVGVGLLLIIGRDIVGGAVAATPAGRIAETAATVAGAAA